MRRPSLGIVGMNEPQSVSAPNSQSESSRLRLAMAARIVAGICANPNAFEGADWQGSAARCAWDIAGRLQRLADSGGG